MAIRVIPPKPGETQCRVVPPTDFADKRIPTKLQWKNQTGGAMTVLVPAGLLGRGPVSLDVADGRETDEMPVALDAPRGVNVYHVVCEIGGPAKGASEPEIVVEP